MVGAETRHHGARSLPWEMKQACVAGSGGGLADLTQGVPGPSGRGIASGKCGVLRQTHSNRALLGGEVSIKQCLDSEVIITAKL